MRAVQLAISNVTVPSFIFNNVANDCIFRATYNIHNSPNAKIGASAKYIACQFSHYTVNHLYMRTPQHFDVYGF